MIRVRFSVKLIGEPLVQKGYFTLHDVTCVSFPLSRMLVQFYV